jgi:hypothetical protein
VAVSSGEANARASPAPTMKRLIVFMALPSFPIAILRYFAVKVDCGRYQNVSTRRCPSGIT